MWRKFLAPIALAICLIAGLLTPTESQVSQAPGGVSTLPPATVPPVYVSGNWYLPIGQYFAATGATFAGNVLYCTFGGVAANVTIKALGGLVQTAVASSNAQFAVYSVANSGIMTLVDSTGNVSTASAVAVNGAVANTTDRLVVGQLYAFCVNSASAVAFAVAGASAGTVSQLVGSATQANIIIATSGFTLTGKSLSQTFGTWPATITISSMTDVASSGGTNPGAWVEFQVN